MNLRYLVHLIGDIHQPLHVINYFSKDFPNGDESRWHDGSSNVDGKLFNIQLMNDTTPITHDLHFFVDGCAGFFSDDKRLPFVRFHNLCTS